MRFITYVKSLESKINFDDEKNKIDLEDVLFMMRNSKKYALDLESEDTDLIFNIKSAVHENNYADVVINIISTEEQINEDVDYELVNTYEETKEKSNIVSSDEKSKSNKKDDDEKSKELLEKNQNLASVIRLENGHIQITSKDGVVIEKDDLKIYSITETIDMLRNRTEIA